MINFMKPKFFIPVHGEYRHLYAHAKIGQAIAVFTDEQILLLQKREMLLKLKMIRIRLTGKVPAGNVLIDGIGVGDVGNIVLRDRRLLSQDGILIVVVTLNRQDKEIACRS